MRTFLLIIFCAISNVVIAQKQYEYRYWFDIDDSNAVVGTSADSLLHIDIDTSPLAVGFHSLHYQVTDSPYGESVVKTLLFQKVAYGENLNSLVLIDGVKQEDNAKSKEADSSIHLEIDANTLDVGIHTLTVLLYEDGASTSPLQAFFLKVPAATDIADMGIYYIVDNNTEQKNVCTFSDGIAHADLDMSSLQDGLHSITFLLANDKGVTTQSRSAFFIKEPLGGNGIKEYEYWVNDNVEESTIVTFDTLQQLLNITELLPMKSYPLHSSSFHFEISDNIPSIYAKNVFHIRFIDAGNRIAQMSSSYVDYKEGGSISNVMELVGAEGNVKQNKPKDNTIYWYSMSCLIGDSIAVKSDIASSIQIFSPSGEEVYSVAGTESVAFEGLHTHEEGTYYIAIHDVTGTNGNSIDFSWKHFDKYAVLDYATKHIGVFPGAFSINLTRNGFDKLEKVALCTKGKDILTADTINVQNYSKALLRFFFENTDYSYGKYDLKLLFTDHGQKDSLIIKDAIILEAPDFGEIEVSYEEKSRMALPYPVTVKIKNTGNVYYQMLPICVAYDSIDIVDTVAFANFNVIVPKKYIQAGFDMSVTTDNLFNKGIKARVFPLVIPSIDSGEEFELDFNVTANGHH